MKVINFLIKYLWLIRLTVEMIEEVAGDWAGADKKKLAMSAIKSVALNSFNTDISEKWENALGAAIDVIVAVYNFTSDLFKRNKASA